MLTTAAFICSLKNAIIVKYHYNKKINIYIYFFFIVILFNNNTVFVLYIYIYIYRDANAILYNVALILNIHILWH